MNNDVSPLPLGWNIVPMIGYFGERLQVVGPNIQYSIIKGPVLNAFTYVSALGDRYQSGNIGLRDTSLNFGLGLRLFFLTVKYGHDITGRYRGNTWEVSAAWRFELTDRISITPSYKRLYLDSRYVNFYFGISEAETTISPYSFYQGDEAVNQIFGLNTVYKLTESQSLALSGNYTVMDSEIYSSPTVSTKGYFTGSFFWNISF